MKKLLIPIATLMFSMSACNNRHEYDIKSNEVYEKSKASIEELEKKIIYGQLENDRNNIINYINLINFINIKN